MSSEDAVRTGTAANVIQRKLRDARVELEQQRQRLANAAGSAKDGDLGVLQKGRQQWTWDAAGADEGAGGASSSLRTCLAETEKALRWAAPKT